MAWHMFIVLAMLVKEYYPLLSLLLTCITDVFEYLLLTWNPLDTFPGYFATELEM